MEEKPREKKSPGAEPERLTIDLPFEEAVRRALQSPRPPAGYPTGQSESGAGRWIMDVRDWHPGQLALLWVVAVFGEWLLIRSILRPHFVPNTLGYAVLWLIPIVLFVVTWRWFDARKQDGGAS
ncbi:MAG TPA: hypothetical protein VF746_28990 [Longimicrobium sp.]|jgi:hypothetical protein